MEGFAIYYRYDSTPWRAEWATAWDDFTDRNCQNLGPLVYLIRLPRRVRLPGHETGTMPSYRCRYISSFTSRGSVI
jgi:hypothetical protein